jgi:hypothetical protein
MRTTAEINNDINLITTSGRSIFGRTKGKINAIKTYNISGNALAKFINFMFIFLLWKIKTVLTNDWNITPIKIKKMLSTLKLKNIEDNRTRPSINIELKMIRDKEDINKLIVSSSFLLTNMAWSYFNDNTLEKKIKNTVYNVTCPNCSAEYNLTKNGKDIMGIILPIPAKLINEKISFFSPIII